MVAWWVCLLASWLYVWLLLFVYLVLACLGVCGFPIWCSIVDLVGLVLFCLCFQLCLCLCVFVRFGVVFSGSWFGVYSVTPLGGGVLDLLVGLLCRLFRFEFGCLCVWLVSGGFECFAILWFKLAMFILIVLLFSGITLLVLFCLVCLWGLLLEARVCCLLGCGLVCLFVCLGFTRLVCLSALVCVVIAGLCVWAAAFGFGLGLWIVILDVFAFAFVYTLVGGCLAVVAVLVFVSCWILGGWLERLVDVVLGGVAVTLVWVAPCW